MKKKLFKSLSRFLASTLIFVQASGIPVLGENTSIDGISISAVNTSVKDLTVKTVGIIETEPNFSINGGFLN